MNTNRILYALFFVSLLVTSTVAASQLNLINYTGSGYYRLNGRYQYLSSSNYTTYQSAGTESTYYNLLVNTSPLNVGTVSPGSGSYLKGTTVTILETPKTGYTFTGWTCSGTGCYSGTNPAVSVTVNSQITEIANFQASATTSITVSSGKDFNEATNGHNWVASLRWTTNQSVPQSGSAAAANAALQSIILYTNQSKANMLAPGQSMNIVVNPADWRLNFVGDSLGTPGAYSGSSYDQLSFRTSSSGLVTYQNVGGQKNKSISTMTFSASGVSTPVTGIYSYVNTTVVKEAVNYFTVSSALTNAFSVTPESGATAPTSNMQTLNYNLNSYTFVPGSAVNPTGTADVVSGIRNFSNAGIYVTLTNGGLNSKYVSTANPLNVQITGHKPGQTSSSSFVVVFQGFGTQTIPGVALANLTDITLSSDLPYPGVTVQVYESSNVTARNAKSSVLLGTLSYGGPVVLYSVPSSNYLQAGFASNVSYTGENNQVNFALGTSTPGSTTTRTQYFTYTIPEITLNSSTTPSAYAILSITNSSQVGASPLYWLNYSTAGNNGVGYLSSQSGAAMVKAQAGFRTERGSEVASVSTTSLTYYEARSVDLLRFSISAVYPPQSNSTIKLYYQFSTLIGSVLNSGVLNSANLQLTKNLLGGKGASIYVYHDTSGSGPFIIAASPTPPSAYEGIGISPGSTVIANTNGGGMQFSRFTNNSQDNLVRLTNAQVPGLLSNSGPQQESEFIWLGGFPVYDQNGNVSNFAVLDANGAYQITFGKPIPAKASVQIELLGTNYTIYNMTPPTLSNINSAGFEVGGKVSLINTINTTPSYSLTVSASPSSGGTVTGAGSYSEGSSVTISETPKTGYTFTGWSCTGSAATICSVIGTETSFSFTMLSSTTVTANYQKTTTPIYYNVNAYSNPVVGGSVNNAGKFMAGMTANLSEKPSYGYAFTGWKCTGSVTCPTGTQSSFSFTVTGNASVTANFKVLPSYTVKVYANPSNGGSVNFNTVYLQNGSVSYGQTGQLIETPAAGYTFTGWTGTGNESYTGSLPNPGIVVYGNIVETANYKANATTLYSLSVSASPSSGGTVTGNGNYSAGSKVTVSETPKAGYTFTGWSCTGTGCWTGIATSGTVTVNNAMTETANFKASASVNTTLTIDENPSAAAAGWGACVAWTTLAGATGQVCAGPSVYGGKGVVANATVPIGTLVTDLYAEPWTNNGGGYAFSNWSGSYNSTNANPGYGKWATVSGPTTIQTNYVKVTTLTIQESYNPSDAANDWGACIAWKTPSGATGQICTGHVLGSSNTTTVPIGTSVTAMWTNPWTNNGGGYSFTGWSGAYNSTSSDLVNQVFATVTGPTTIQANYKT
jgi:uncharacterized repeat protein (TIGR02543 family)